MKFKNYQKELRVAISVAKKAGKYLLREFRKKSPLRIEIKNRDPVNYVTQVDRASEKIILSEIKKNFSADSFLTEEEGKIKGSEKRRWIIDPLDGTTNFIHQFPLFAVSIALEEDSQLKVGVVYVPTMGEIFYAARGWGAFCDGKRIKVSALKNLRHALIATGFPFKEFHIMPRYLRIFREMARRTAGIRRPGVASVDLSYLAAGRIDGFWEFGLSAWDVAAGALIIEEAGGVISDVKGGKEYLKGNVVGSNGRLHKVILKIVKES